MSAVNGVAPSLSTLAQDQQALLTDLDLEAVAAAVGAATARLGASTFRVVLIGEHNRGKSTLLNALARQRLFKTSALSSNTINRLRWAPEPSILVIRGGARRQLSLDELEAAYAQDEDFAHVDIAAPVELCQGDVELIELPSMSHDAGGLSGSETTLQDTLAGADLVIVTLASDSLYARSEAEFVRRDIIEGAGHQRLLFVCNLFDRINEAERSDVHAHAERRLPAAPDQIFFTSAQDALEQNDSEASGVPALRSRLRALAEADRGRLRSERLRTLLRHGLEQARTGLDRRAVEHASQAEQLIRERQRLGELFQELRVSQRQVIGDLQGFRSQIHEVLETRTGEYVRSLANMIERWAASYTGDQLYQHISSRLKHEFEQWLYNEITVYLNDQLATQRQVLGKDLERFAARYTQLISQVGGQPAQIEVDIADLRLNGDQLQLARHRLGDRRIVLLQDMPEVLVVAAGAILAGFFWTPLVTLPVGLGVAAWLGYNKVSTLSREAQHQEVRAYVVQVRSQSDTIALHVAGMVDKHIGQSQEALSARLAGLVHELEGGLAAHLERFRPQTDQGALAALRQRLDQVGQDLGRLD